MISQTSARIGNPDNGRQDHVSLYLEQEPANAAQALSAAVVIDLEIFQALRES